MTTSINPYRIHITPSQTGLWGITQTEEAAKKATELLQKDIEKHHVYFNHDGFHNHIPHHVLALYGTGASPEALQAAYDSNQSYQRPAIPTHAPVIQDLIQTWDHSVKSYLGKDKHYPDFLRFFQQRMESHGGKWQPVVSEYLFRGNAVTDDLLVRLHAGFLHPLIQLMYGIEWDQPAIVAEALAQAAVHSDDIKDFLLESEKLANAGKNHYRGDNAGGEMPRIVDLLARARANPKLAGAASMENANQVRDGVFSKAFDDMVSLAAEVRIRPEELEERTAEMFDACVYMATAAAVWKEGKVPKYDFFLMHHVTSAPFFVTVNAQPWIPTEIKVRLLEWKIRMDLLQYAARGVPPLSLDKVASYQAKKPSQSTVDQEIQARLHFLPDDDGHAIKLARAAGVCRRLTKQYAASDRSGRFQIKGDDLWNKTIHLMLDAIESPGTRWVRTAGLDEAWKNFPNTKDSKF